MAKKLKAGRKALPLQPAHAAPLPAALPDNQLRVRAAVSVFIHHKLSLVGRTPIAALTALPADLRPGIPLFIVQQLRRPPIGQASFQIDTIPLELMQLCERFQFLYPEHPKLFEQLLFHKVLLTG